MKLQSEGFWHWFLHGTGYKRGFRRIVNSWLIFHCIVGLALAFLVQQNLEAVASTLLLPLAGIFIGLTFAWAGNAQGIMQTSEIHELASFHEGGFEEYIYIYQTAVLTVLTTITCWGMAGLDIFDSRFPLLDNSWTYFLSKVFLFSLSSLALRECWQVVNGAHWMLLMQRNVRRIHDAPNDDEIE